MTTANVGERHRDVTYQIISLRMSKTSGDDSPATEKECREALTERDAIVRKASNRGLRTIIRTMELVTPDFWDYTKTLGHKSPLAYFKAKRKRLKSGRPWEDTWA